MTENLKQKYITILNLSRKFFKFGKMFDTIEKNFLPEHKQNLNALQLLNYCDTINGKDYWELIEFGENDVSVLLKKSNTNYSLKIINLSTITSKSVDEVSSNMSTDENGVILLDVHNNKKGIKYFIEIVVAKEENKTFLVEKDWVYSLSEDKWSLECSNIELNKEQEKII